MPSFSRPWDPPRGYQQAASGCPAIQLYNSLVDEKRVLVPHSGPCSRELSWYSCGPTVYDSAHLGHSRNYVNFDILRRILQDYFGYSVTAVMNVTDVDYKIINRARRRHLLAQYRARSPALQEVRARAARAAAHAPHQAASTADVQVIGAAKQTLDARAAKLDRQVQALAEEQAGAERSAEELRQQASPRTTGPARPRACAGAQAHARGCRATCTAPAGGRRRPQT